MKKLLVLVLALALASTAYAGLSYQLNGGGTSVAQNSSVTIEVVADAIVSSFTIGGVTMTGSGTIGAVGTLNAKFDAMPLAGTLKNGATSNIYIFDLGGGTQAGSPKPAAGEVIYSFSLGTGAAGGTITIDDFSGTNPFPPPPTPKLTQLNLVNDNPAALVLTIIPEPVTIALLGLGGLFLRRRK